MFARFRFGLSYSINFYLITALVVLFCVIEPYLALAWDRIEAAIARSFGPKPPPAFSAHWSMLPACCYSWSLTTAIRSLFTFSFRSWCALCASPTTPLCRSRNEQPTKDPRQAAPQDGVCANAS